MSEAVLHVEAPTATSTAPRQSSRRVVGRHGGLGEAAEMPVGVGGGRWMGRSEMGERAVMKGAGAERKQNPPLPPERQATSTRGTRRG